MGESSFVRRVALLVLLLSAVPMLRARAAPPDPLYPVKQLGDLVAGAQQAQRIPGANQTQPFGAHPGLMPDWNRDGIYGNRPDYAIENSTQPGVAPFRFPCIGMDGSIAYETIDGRCAAGDADDASFRTGSARKALIIDSAGWQLAATLFLPSEALGADSTPLPGVVIADGAQASMQTFYMYAMTLAARGIIVLSFDFAGQGQSEDRGAGFLNDFFRDVGSVEGNCRAPRSCRETQDVMRWFTGEQIVPFASEHPGSHNPADNVPNPVLDRLDTSRIGLIGQSMGALTVSNYLWYLPTGRGADRRPLPPIRAAIGLSGFAPASAIVPYQLQTADLDIPGITADNFGFGATDGPVGTKAFYDQLRASGTGDGALSLIVIESGSHGDTSNSTRFNGVGTPHAVWSWALSTAYAADWMGCHLQGDTTACAMAISARPHLSRAQASEYDLDGPAGAEPSRCITIPDRATLEQLVKPSQFVHGELGRPTYDCAP